VSRSVPLAVRAGPAQVDLVALNRTSGTAVTGRFKIVNRARAALDLSFVLSETGADDNPGLGAPLSASGIGLLDGRAGKLYLPLQRSGGGAQSCLCSDLNRTTVPPGGSTEIYAVFPAPPAGVRRVTVTMPLAVPIQDVPLGQGPVPPLPGQIDPASTRLAAPRILDVTSVAEGVEESVDDVAGNRAVRLSSDVLFAVDKADLTPRAGALLRKVAKQIDASRGPTVKVDGYTDTTGNDAINQPLSRRRAQVVADRLKSLVTRQGVAFQVAGHGSQDPVAPNDTDEGRRKNRRTTVSFARPVPPAPQVTGAPYNRTDAAPPVLGSAPFTAGEAAGLKVEVNSLHRDAAGLVTLVWTVRNTGNGSPDLTTHLEKNPQYHGAAPPRRGWSAGGVMIIDPVARVRYEPLSTWSGACLCAAVGVQTAKRIIGPGESAVFGAVYKPADEVRTVDVQVPWSKPDDANVQGVPIR
jgi:outer membrane protein OmpA-like peptidoglycan-associated protein